MKGGNSPTNYHHQSNELQGNLAAQHLGAEGRMKLKNNESRGRKAIDQLHERAQ